MSLGELNDGWERQFIGARFTRRLADRLMAEHAERLRREVNLRIFESVVVSVLDSGGRIKGIGLNEPQDLILDNFGSLLAALIRTPTTADLSLTLVDDGGTGRSFWIYAALAAGKHAFNAGYGASFSWGTRLRVGSGTTAPARGDYTIETPFTVSPESGYFGSGTGSYSAGVISFSASITAGGSGTIRETGFFGYWIDSAVAYRNIMLFRDLVSAVSFAAGNTITVSYTINL